MMTMTRPTNMRGSQSSVVLPQASVAKNEVSATSKTRASRLPTMPLHMTTRARKNSPSEGDSKVTTTQQISPSSRTAKRANYGNSSENQPTMESAEPLKKKLRSSQTVAIKPKQKTPDLGSKLNTTGSSDSSVNSRKEKTSRNQSTQSEQNGFPLNAYNTQNSSNSATRTQDNLQSSELGHLAKDDEAIFSPFAAEVPRETIHKQYLKRRELAKKNATLEQLQMRQALISEQYRLMATLAKETNLVLIHKSIELLNKTHDGELGASYWAQNILGILEQRELKRFQQVEFKRKLDLIDARHEFNVMRNALYDSCDTRIVELRERHLCQIMEAIAEVKNQHGYDEETSDDEETHVPSSSGLSGNLRYLRVSSKRTDPKAPIPVTSYSATGLDLLAFESSRQSHLPEQPNDA